MIYIDTSVVLAALFAEDRKPPITLWDHQLFSSRLLSYELWTHVNRLADDALCADAEKVLTRINFVELSNETLKRVLEPFPERVRTLDAMHLSSLCFLRDRRIHCQLATYDKHMAMVGEQLGFSLFSL